MTRSPVVLALAAAALTAGPRVVLAEPEASSEHSESIVWEHVPTAGFTMTNGRADALIELGYPFLDLALRFRLHDRVSFRVGYRGMYAWTNGLYGSLKFGLYRNPGLTFGLSLSLGGGYMAVYEAEFVWLVGGNSGFGEAAIALSWRWGRHALDLIGGAKLAWIEPFCHLTYNDWSCRQNHVVIANDEAGILATAFLDVEWSVRIRRLFSLYLALGADVFTNSVNVPVMPRFRLGFLIEM